MDETVMLYEDCPSKMYEDGKLPNIGFCDVKIAGQTIIIDYIDVAKERVLWRCTEFGSGHYVCKKDGAYAGDATLHRVQGKNVFEGYWKLQSGGDISEGMWRITLGKLRKRAKNIK